MVTYRFERVGAALQAGLLPLSKFDELPEGDKAEIIEYLRERDMMQEYEAQLKADEILKENMRRK